MTRSVSFAARVLVAAVLLTSVASAQTAPVKHSVAASDGHQLALWEKKAAQPKGAILLLHGRTWSTLPDFDLQVPGEHRSLMDALVARGYSVYGLDLRGYGATPRDATDWDTPDRSVEDLSAAIAWVAKNSGAPGKPALLGWSNGSMVSALFAKTHGDQISALMLTGYPMHPDSTFATIPDTAKPAHAKTTAKAAASDFIAPGAISKKAVDVYVAAALKADPVLTDWRRMEQWNGIDPKKIKVPTLLIQGELDPYASTATQAAFFSRLGTADRQWVVMAGGDHASLMEDMQPAFVSAMVNFIERPVWRK
jgi:alpha-beta hydrolase superfamily lysophospholipase